MVDSDVWRARFHRIMHFIHGEHGWRIPFMLRGCLLLPVGFMGIRRRPMNDNRPQRPRIIKE